MGSPSISMFDSLPCHSFLCCCSNFKSVFLKRSGSGPAACDQRREDKQPDSKKNCANLRITPEALNMEALYSDDQRRSAGRRSKLAHVASETIQHLDHAIRAD